MAKLSWLYDWQEIVAALPGWLLLLSVGVILAFTIIIVLLRRRHLVSNAASVNPASASNATREAEVPDFLKQANPSSPPADPISLHGTDSENDNPAKDATSASAIDDRAAGWRPLYPYFKDRRFTTWKPEDVSASVDEEACPLAIKLFISHRWQRPDDPDPHLRALPTVVEYLSRVYMTANGLLDANSYLAKELVAGDDLRRAFEERSLGRCTCGSIGWLDVRSLLSHGDVFYERVRDTSRRRNFYRLLKHVRIWYDYTSLPQARATSEEQAAFDRAFSRLAGVVSQADVLALWGLESINRAWCMFEVLAGKKVHFCAPAQAARDPQLKMMFQAYGYSDLGDYQGRPSMNIMIHANSFRAAITGMGQKEIERYLRERGIECTKDEDFARVAGLIRQYLGH